MIHSIVLMFIIVLAGFPIGPVESISQSCSHSIVNQANAHDAFMDSGTIELQGLEEEFKEVLQSTLNEANIEIKFDLNRLASRAVSRHMTVGGDDREALKNFKKFAEGLVAFARNNGAKSSLNEDDLKRAQKKLCPIYPIC